MTLFFGYGLGATTALVNRLVDTTASARKCKHEFGTPHVTVAAQSPRAGSRNGFEGKCLLPTCWREVSIAYWQDEINEAVQTVGNEPIISNRVVNGF
jgi:hypothetical protein